MSDLFQCEQQGGILSSFLFDIHDRRFVIAVKWIFKQDAWL